MNVSITPRLRKFVETLVKSGRYASSSEVIREALRLLEEEEQLRKKKLEWLKGEVKKGMDDIKAGRVVPGEVVFDELRTKLRRMRRGAA